MAAVDQQPETLQINEWFLHYGLHMAWSEFKDKKTISSNWLRIASGLMNLPFSDIERIQEIRLFFLVICRLFEGEKPLVLHETYGDGQELTPLEDLLTPWAALVGMQSDLETRTRGETLAVSIQFAAVIVCWNADEKELAYSVIDRQFGDPDKTNKEVYKKVCELKECLDADYYPKNDNFYNDFVSRIVKFLSGIYDNFGTPLVIAASQFLQEEANSQSTYADTSQNNNTVLTSQYRKSRRAILEACEDITKNDRPVLDKATCMRRLQQIWSENSTSPSSEESSAGGSTSPVETESPSEEESRTSNTTSRLSSSDAPGEFTDFSDSTLRENASRSHSSRPHSSTPMFRKPLSAIHNRRNNRVIPVFSPRVCLSPLPCEADDSRARDGKRARSTSPESHTSPKKSATESSDDDSSPVKSPGVSMGQYRRNRDRPDRHNFDKWENCSIVSDIDVDDGESLVYSHQPSVAPKWTQEEMDSLIRAHIVHGSAWQIVKDSMKTNRTIQAIKKKWQLLCSRKNSASTLQRTKEIEAELKNKKK